MGEGSWSFSSLTFSKTPSVPQRPLFLFRTQGSQVWRGASMTPSSKPMRYCEIVIYVRSFGFHERRTNENLSEGFFLLGTVLSFHNNPRPDFQSIPSYPKKTYTKLSPGLTKLGKMLYGTPAVKIYKRGLREKRKEGVRYCESCDMPEANTPFMQCKPCRDIGRRNFYCSR